MSNVMGQTSVRWNHVSMILSSCFLSTSCSPVNLCYLYVLLHAIAIYILCSLLLSAPLFQEPCKTTSLNSGIILLSCSTLSFPTVWPPSSPDPVRYFYHNKSLIMIFFFIACLSFLGIMLQDCHQQNVASQENLQIQKKGWSWRDKKEIHFQEEHFQVLKAQGKLSCF